ncbi:MAG: cytochrome c3 family protein [Armatimonadota bacterium]|nr:cytochrome c3 family protein [Armatimonadota bacterium]
MVSLKLRAVIVAALICAFGLLLVGASFAQDYKASKTCKMCHTAMHPAIVQGFDKIAHPKALQDAAKNPAAVVAVCDANSPVKAADIKYVLGVGKRGQAYIGADMKTLPAEWSVTEKKWVTTSVQDAKTQCIGCHVTGYDAAKATWAEEGVNCDACHGPGSAHLADKTKIVNPKKLTPDKEAMVCGQCHSKGTDTTKAYAFPITYKPGGDLAQAFIDAQPKTAGRNQQYSEWKTSKHAGPAGVTCVKCHEPHGANTTQPTQLRKPIVELCTGAGCHTNKDMKTHAPLAPAGATCATCHMRFGRHDFAKPGA